MEEQPPTQSPFISSSGGFLDTGERAQPPPPVHRELQEEEDEDDDPAERRPWEEDDFGDNEVLDLTGGAGDFSHPPFTVRFPGAEVPPRAPAYEEEKPAWGEEMKRKPSWEEEAPERPQPSAPSEEEEVPPDRRPTAPVITPLAPLAPPSPPQEEPARRRGPSGSVEKMDLLEQLSSSVSPDQEDFTSLLHDSSASLASVSSFSASPPKDHSFAASTLSQQPFTEAVQDPLSHMYLESTGVNQPAKMSEHNGFEPEQKPEPEVFSAPHPDQEFLFSEGNQPLNQISEPMHKTALFDEPLFSKTLPTGGSGTDELAFHVAFEEESPIRAEYVDFKPYLSAVESRIDGQEPNVDGKSEVHTNVCGTQSNVEMEKTHALSESVHPSQSHFTPAPVGAAAPHELISENKTDEKKMAEMEARWSTEQGEASVSASNPFMAKIEWEADYVTTDASPKLMGHVTSRPESLTPDLVQEACETAMHDLAGAQLTYTSKIDLVQTSELLPEPLISSAQMSPSFESTESVQSPVLPDIVMEAPAATGALGIETAMYIAHHDASPLEDTAPQVHEEQIKLESETPPSYEEAVKVPLAQDKKDGAEGIMFKQPTHVESTAFEEIETPYISIACDLIKETQISNEFLPPGFTDLSENTPGNFTSICMPAHPSKDDSSSSESEEMDLDRQWVPKVSKEATEAIASIGQNRLVDVMSCARDESSVTDPFLSKAYMESFQPEFDHSNILDFSSNAPADAVFSKEEKHLEMEEVGNVISSENDLLAYHEHKAKEAPSCTVEPSPVQKSEDFMTMLADTKAAEVVSKKIAEAIESEEKESKRNVPEVEAKQVPLLDFAGEVPSVKDVAVKTEGHVSVFQYSPDHQEVPAVHPLPKQSVSSIQENVASTVKPEVLEKEATTECFPKEERSESKRIAVPEPVSSVPSARLGKASVVDLLYWRDIKKSGVVFGASLFLLLSLTVFSIVSVSAYIALALLSVTISYRMYKGVFQAIQKSDDGHPFRAYLERDVALSDELVHKYSNVVLDHLNCAVKELRRLFLVEDLVDSLKFAVLMWVFTYVGALFNGLTLLILALISLFSVPVIYERHQTQIDHYLGLVNRNVKDVVAKIQSKIPGLKPKAE
ncbi:reticulon-4 isoform X2 [Lissotriton helveticus]